MLDPAGDARTPGRIIGDNFERGINLEFAQALKEVLEQMGTNLRIVLTREPHEAIAPLQNANFSNRLNVDLFISMHCYQERGQRPSIHLYYIQYHPITDMWHKPEQLAFYPYDQAHLLNLSKSTAFAEALKKSLSISRKWDCKGPFGIPFKPLIGVKAPSLALEIGIKNKDDWQVFIHPLAQAIAGVFAST
jgi:N-acetylmuramoyl-L-alanine amidase